MGCYRKLLPWLDHPPPNCPLLQPLQKPQRCLAKRCNEPLAPCPGQYYLTSPSCSPIWSHLLPSVLEKCVFLPQRLAFFFFLSLPCSYSTWHNKVLDPKLRSLNCYSNTNNKYAAVSHSDKTGQGRTGHKLWLAVGDTDTGVLPVPTSPKIFPFGLLQLRGFA